jgi:hypothetical protein
MNAPLFPPPVPLSADHTAIEQFRDRNRMSSELNCLAAFPNYFFTAHDTVGGTILIRHGAAQWRDVPLSELDNSPLDDFGQRFRATHVYATDNGFVGGFPTFEHADYGHGIVCGTILFPAQNAEWRDVPLSELGNAPLDDIGQRFRATQKYATDHGFVGGFPNFFHADHGRGIVCGTLLLSSDTAEWRDVKIGQIID